MNLSKTKTACLIAILLGVVTCAEAKPAPPVPPPVIKVTVNDLSPKFLKFYDEAQKAKAPPDARWELWKKDYHFAAVPPTPEGDAMARKMLDAAWPRYAAAMDVIGRGANGMKPDGQSLVSLIAAQLKPEKPAEITLLTYVGNFEDNAFTYADEGKITTAVSLEGDPGMREFLMTHELTHAVHIAMGSLSGGWIRTIGTTVVAEGLAMRTTQKLVKRPTEAAYVERTPGWFADATAHRAEILKDVRAVLESSKSEDVMRYTMGKGPSGVEREAYYAGWVVVGYWLEKGMTLAQIARIPEAQMPDRVRAAIDEMQAVKWDDGKD